MTQSTTPRRRGFWLAIAAAFVIGALLMAGLAALLVNIQEKKTEAAQFPLKLLDIPANELNPEVWGRNFPRQYATFNKTSLTTTGTPYGGSVPYSKLQKNAALVKLWAGYAFSVDHNEDRGHFYAASDQANTKRVQVVNQPGACANCHAAEAPQLIAAMGWENFNKTLYNDIKDKLHYGSSCADCHDPQTMDLRITRPALLNALKARGVDITTATRQEMRTYVCAQCHVEYYFAGDNKVLTFPWSKGLNIDNIEEYYTQIGFRDWVHKDSGAPMLKMQHPEYELYSTGIHARSGVSCADCHMPYVREGSVKISDHWVRSPLTNVTGACQTCHRWGDEELKARIIEIQQRTARSLASAEEALSDAIDAIAAAKAGGSSDEALAKARDLHRRASMRWDFISSENSTGFHSPQEAARVLGDSMNLARQAQIEAIKLTKK